MSVFAGFSTSRDIWLRVPELIGCPTTAQPSPQHGPGKSEMEMARSALPFSLPDEEIHILVPHSSCRRVNPGFKCHVWNGPTRGSYLHVGNGVYLSTPEACWSQMATALDVTGAAILGYQLCSSYIPIPPLGTPNAARSPLSTPKKLIAFFERTTQTKGRRVADEALRYISGNAASPRETAIALLLSLPRRLGGYGLPVPVLNRKIPLGHMGQSLTSRGYFVADLMWPEHNLCVEYDSDLFHRKERQAVMDSNKRNALQAMGFTVVTLTNAQVKNVRAFDEAARALAVAMGVSLRIRRSRWLQDHMNLRRRVLF